MEESSTRIGILPARTDENVSLPERGNEAVKRTERVDAGTHMPIFAHCVVPQRFAEDFPWGLTRRFLLRIHGYPQCLGRGRLAAFHRACSLLVCKIGKGFHRNGQAGDPDASYTFFWAQSLP
jgi:hypothetical protein